MARLRFGTLLAAGAIIVAACGGSTATSAPASEAPASAEPGASSAPSEPAAGEPKDGGTLVVAIPGDIKRTDPALIDDSNTSYVMQNVMEGLVTLKPGTTGELEPGLAESWELSRRRPDVHVQDPRRRQVPRRHGPERGGGQVQLRPLAELPEGAAGLQLLRGRRVRRLRRRIQHRVDRRPGSDDLHRHAEVPGVELPAVADAHAVHDQQPDGPQGRRGGQHRRRRDPDPVRPGRRGLDDRHRPVQVRQLDARRQRQDREEPRLLERRQGGPPRRGHLQAGRRGGPAPQRPEHRRARPRADRRADRRRDDRGEPRPRGHRPRRVVQPVPRAASTRTTRSPRTPRSARPSPTRSTSRP